MARPATSKSVKGSKSAKAAVQVSAKTSTLTTKVSIKPTTIASTKVSKKREAKNLASPAGYELIICEKPQAAEKIATALATGKLRKMSDNKVSYYELEHAGKEIVVAAAVGHLFGLGEKEKKTWTYPVFSIEWKPSSEISKGHFSKKYADVIKKLAKDASEITVATDYDVEGEVIGLNIVRYLCKKKDAHRMKFSTLVTKDIIDSYQSKAPTLNWGQASAGETRHMLDWYWGINISRALTLAVKKARGGFKLLSAGRVQGPALKLIVDREKEIAAFVPQKYWQIRADLQKAMNKSSQLQLFESWHERDKFWEQKEVEQIFASIKNGNFLVVFDLKRSTSSQSPPIPFDLTTLQTEAHKTCGISPKDTLEIAQNLYTQGYISYPRTSSQKLPQQLGLRNILQELAKQQSYAKLVAQLFTKKTALVPHEGKKTDDAHPSIYPTGVVPQKLVAREAKLYDLIVRRFMSVFAEAAIRETMKVFMKTILTMQKNQATNSTEEQHFILEGTRTKEKGWHIYYEPYLRLEEIELPNFENGEQVPVKTFALLDKETQPPKRFTESSLIRALEKATIGTKSTRAQIIETLKDRGYVSHDPLTASALGIKTVETLQKHTPRILDEELTRHFEEEMEDIRKGKRNEAIVISEAQDVLRLMLSDFKKEEDAIGAELGESERQRYDQQNLLGPCTLCNKGNLMIRKSKFGLFIGCTAYPECKKTFSLPKVARVRPANSTCAECQYPLVLVREARSSERAVCINPKCITWTPEYQKQHQKQSTQEQASPSK